jgi:hypothetical protein
VPAFDQQNRIAPEDQGANAQQRMFRITAASSRNSDSTPSLRFSHDKQRRAR